MAGKKAAECTGDASQLEPDVPRGLRRAATTSKSALCEAARGTLRAGPSTVRPHSSTSAGASFSAWSRTSAARCSRRLAGSPAIRGWSVVSSAGHRQARTASRAAPRSLASWTATRRAADSAPFSPPPTTTRPRSPARTWLSWLSRSTITGQSAWAATVRLTEPSTISTKPLRLRVPSTRGWAEPDCVRRSRLRRWRVMARRRSGPPTTNLSDTRPTGEQLFRVPARPRDGLNRIHHRGFGPHDTGRDGAPSVEKPRTHEEEAVTTEPQYAVVAEEPPRTAASGSVAHHPAVMAAPRLVRRRPGSARGAAVPG